MKNFSICLHCEVKDLGVKVQCVLAGFTRTDLGRYIGLDMTQAKDVLFARWMLPEDVVRISLRDLRSKNSVICIPGAGNKALYVMAKLIPARLWNRLSPSIANRMP